jgi:hypothetical protein
MGWATGWEGSYDVKWPGTANAGNRENLMDPIVILDPTDTPVLNMLPKEEWPAPYVEWLTDTLIATATGAAYEGAEWKPGVNFDDSASFLTSRVRYKNNTQINTIAFAATRSQIQTSQRGLTAGVRNEYQYQLFKAMKALMRNIDARIVVSGATAVCVTGDMATARFTCGLRGFTGASSVNVSGLFATASYASLRATMDTNGADPDTMFVNSPVKVAISAGVLGGTLIPNGGGTTAVQGLLRRFNADAYEKELSTIIDVMEDDFGRVVLIRDRWMPSANTTAGTGTTAGAAYILLDRSKAKVGFFQRPDHFPLPPNGDSQRGFVLAEWGTKLLHPYAMGVGANVTNV